MKKLSLDAPATEQIEINGEIFDVNMSDIDIINKCADLSREYADLKKDDIESIKSAVNEIIGFIDKILGDGAVVKISNGKPVNTVTAYNWLMSIYKAVYEEQDKYIEYKYE
ncbi:MAG: hypothetical protein FWD71_03320 [Oscillospiraceae bacterium]|nr:hypothetical protein [Oscillospiraceae bacterium]